MKFSHCCVAALLTITACDLESIPFGSIEAPAGLECYRWSVHKTVDDPRGAPTAMVFDDDGDLYLGGSPYLRSVVLDDGRGDMHWESRVDLEGETAEDHHAVRAMIPREQGGVIAAVQADDAVILDTIGANGERLGSTEVPTGLTVARHIDLIALDDGMALSTIDTLDDGYTLTIRKFDRDQQLQWKHQVELEEPAEARMWWDGGLVALPEGGLVQVASSVLRDGTTGARFLRISDDGATEIDVELSLHAWTSDIALHPSGDVFVLAEKIDHIEVLRVDSKGEVVWSVRPRDGQDIEASHLAWDDHTQRLLVAGGTRPAGEVMHGYWVVLNENGGQEWSHVGGPNSETTAALIPSPEGGFLMGSWSERLRLHQFVASTCD